MIVLPAREVHRVMRESDQTTPADEGDQERYEGGSIFSASDDEESDFDWIVFVLRTSALIVFGATIITSVELSLNQDVDWINVMRLAVLPFVGGMLVLAAGELVDRQGD